MRTLLKTIAILLTLALAVPALAVDYWGGPPPGTWQRGLPSTTFQHWMFSATSGPMPEVFDNPYGPPLVELTGFERGEWECPPELDPDGFVDGVHCFDPAGGVIVLTIPNTETVDGAKWIFMQITSSKAPSNVSTQGSGGAPGGYTSSTWPTGLPHIQWPGPAPYGGQWYTYNFGLKIEPNPQVETITIEVPYCTVIDQIVVDTLCTGTVGAEQRSWSGVKSLFR